MVNAARLRAECAGTESRTSAREQGLGAIGDCPGRSDGAMRNLEAKAWLALAVLTGVMALLLFVPAGTLHYWQAWVYLAIFAGVSALTTLDLIRKDPALLERRM